MKQSLSRDIPEAVQRTVRQNCGFGCVVCGSIIYMYHHFEPEFSLAAVHDPSGIILLCASCHDKVHRGFLSNETLKRSINNPKCLQEGYSHTILDVGERQPIIKIGKATFVANSTILRIFGKRIFYIEAPEVRNGPFQINFQLFNTENLLECQIVNNEWQAFSNSWDIECVANTLTIRRAKREIALKILVDVPNGLVIERMNMYYKGIRVTVSPDGKTTVYQQDGTMLIQMESPIFIGNDTIIQID